MEVTRTQYPVGQGCFHAGRIEWGYPDSGSSDDFHYVYDCGSSSGSAVLQDAVVEWPSQVPRLDALFVSHLDTDHVNGIDRLLASVTSAPANVSASATSKSFQAALKVKSVRVSGAAFTAAGRELLKVVDIEPMPAFTERLKAHFAKSKYQMIEVGDAVSVYPDPRF